jgi:hypothetical protein
MQLICSLFVESKLSLVFLRCSFIGIYDREAIPTNDTIAQCCIEYQQIIIDNELDSNDDISRFDTHCLTA